MRNIRVSAVAAVFVIAASAPIIANAGLGEAGTLQAPTSLATLDAGWQQPVLVDPNHGPLNAISCVTEDFCVAVNYLGDFFVFDGTGWRGA